MNTHTHTHTHTQHRDKVIAISALAYYVVGADDNSILANSAIHPSWVGK